MTINNGAQWLMDRNGKIYRLVPPNAKAGQTLPSWGAPGTRWATNSNTEGIEIIAKDDEDVTQAQVDSFKRFAFWHSQVNGYDPQTHILGHGEINGVDPTGAKHPGKYIRQPTEGRKAKVAFEGVLPSMEQRWHSAALTYPSGYPEGAGSARQASGTANPTGSLTSDLNQPGYSGSPVDGHPLRHCIRR
jgi:hypothetical protein